MVTRRGFLKSSAMLPLLLGQEGEGISPTSKPSLPHVAVIGAGAMGGWTAWHLLRLGVKVTIVDAWGPGNSRSSSGGETRVIRTIYGGSRRHIEWSARSFAQWREMEKSWGRPLYHRTGALWMFAGPDDYARSSLEAMTSLGMAARELSLEEGWKRFPQISFEGIRSVFVEEEAGYITARIACEAVLESCRQQGAEYRQAALAQFENHPAARHPGSPFMTLSDETRLKADLYVLACGPWLGTLLPWSVGDLIRPTRQEVFFFGPPKSDTRFDEGNLPVWIEMGGSIFYGIPAAQGRGFKIADDTRGEPLDPTFGDRVPSAEGIERARRAMAARFPAMAQAPLLEARVCQYENTPDGDFIVDRLAGRSDTWIVGGGSGHAFKMGPAIGEHVARVVLGRAAQDPSLRLSRFKQS